VALKIIGAEDGVAERIEAAIRDAIPDALVQVKTGGAAHFEVQVVSEAFRGKSMVLQHQLVYGAIAPLMASLEGGGCGTMPCTAKPSVICGSCGRHDNADGDQSEERFEQAYRHDIILIQRSVLDMRASLALLCGGELKGRSPVQVVSPAAVPV